MNYLLLGVFTIALGILVGLACAFSSGKICKSLFSVFALLLRVNFVLLSIFSCLIIVQLPGTSEC